APSTTSSSPEARSRLRKCARGSGTGFPASMGCPKRNASSSVSPPRPWRPRARMSGAARRSTWKPGSRTRGSCSTRTGGRPTCTCALTTSPGDRTEQMNRMKRNTTIIGVLLPFTLATGGCGAGSAELPAIKGNVGEAPSMGGGGTQPEGVLSEMVIEGDGSKVGANDLLVAEITSFPREEGEEPGTEPSFSSHDLDTEVLLSMPEFAAASAAR